ncbi:hypothetical protein V8J88_15415 [Massilia sp. W12]|uniref:hypothetical protein n=1 Tax=Massilia sp. W12 TaxID=3126507 RepID=UPI0030CED29D
MPGLSFETDSILRRLNLLVHGPHQMARRNIPERLIVHQTYKDFFVAMHALDEQVLKLLVEYGLEVFDAIGHDGLTRLLSRLPLPL